MWYLVRKLSKYLLFFNSLLIAWAIALPAMAQITITDIAISEPHNGIATVTWNTSEPTKSDVYFGTSDSRCRNRGVLPKQPKSTYRGRHQ